MAVELIKDKDGSISATFRFGGGLNTTTNPADIDPREASAGENFHLQLDGGSLKKRAPFSLIATATNNREIMGGGEYIDADGNVSAFIQAGPTVYKWNGASTFTSVATVNQASRLRGDRHSTSILDGYAIVTDLARQETVKTWNGTTFADLSHNLGAPLKAKYCIMHEERAFFGNVQSGSATPHVLLGSKRSDVKTLTVTNRPSSALSEEDPFFLAMHDLRPINGMLMAFGLLCISSEDGEINKLSGGSAKDFSIDSLFEGSAAAGDEAIAYVGNDILIGRHGKIESLGAIEAFGDVATDDVSRWIANLIKDIRRWTIKYDARLHRAYLWPELGGNGELYVLEKSLFDPLHRQATRVLGVSPWSIWRTNYGDGAFVKTASFYIRNPADGIDRLYFGDAAGRIFQLDGEGTKDAGSTNIVTSFTTGPVILPLDRDAYDFRGAVYFNRGYSGTVTINALHQGHRLMRTPITLTIAAGSAAHFGGAYYFGGSNYFGMQFEGRLERQYFSDAGAGGQLQFEIEISGANQVEIDRIVLRFVPAK